jgi:hypothetical protein
VVEGIPLFSPVGHGDQGVDDLKDDAMLPGKYAHGTDDVEVDRLELVEMAAGHVVLLGRRRKRFMRYFNQIMAIIQLYLIH